ncbi:MAG: hypothetical protein ACHQ7M_17215, partial [Chloroflexota bacterium]
GDDQRRERGHQRHGHQVHQALVKVHDGSFLGRFPPARRPFPDFRKHRQLTRGTLTWQFARHITHRG